MERTIYEADLSAVTGREELHRLLRETFADRDYTGNNLDAFYDMLTSFGKPAALIFHHFAAAEAVLGDYAERFRLALYYAADDNSENLDVSVEK